MPTYDFQCRSCGHVFEKFQKMSDASVQPCQKCGADAELKISGGGFVFKGSGFYITDYKKTSPQPESGK